MDLHKEINKIQKEAGDLEDVLWDLREKRDDGRITQDIFKFCAGIVVRCKDSLRDVAQLAIEMKPNNNPESKPPTQAQVYPPQTGPTQRYHGD